MNDSKRSKVEELIHNSRVRNIEGSTGEKEQLKEFLNSSEDYLIYLPFAKMLSSKLIKSLNENDCYIFTDRKSCKLRNYEKYIFIQKCFHINKLILLSMMESIRVYVKDFI